MAGAFYSIPADRTAPISFCYLVCVPNFTFAEQHILGQHIVVIQDSQVNISVLK